MGPATAALGSLCSQGRGPTGLLLLPLHLVPRVLIPSGCSALQKQGWGTPWHAEPAPTGLLQGSLRGPHRGPCGTWVWPSLQVGLEKAHEGTRRARCGSCTGPPASTRGWHTSRADACCPGGGSPSTQVVGPAPASVASPSPLPLGAAVRPGCTCWPGSLPAHGPHPGGQPGLMLGQRLSPPSPLSPPLKCHAPSSSAERSPSPGWLRTACPTSAVLHTRTLKLVSFLESGVLEVRD